MATKVVLLGLKLTVVDEVRDHLDMPEVELFPGAGLDDLRAVLAAHEIDHVIMGAGLDLEVRLEAVRTVFETSAATTVHLKDFASGPQGFAPFVHGVLTGMKEFQPGPRD